MDSLSQIVLGAAVGEVVLGRKIGNKAMVWGGIAGTIPDLDIIASPFLTELEALSFHRGITHSIFFAVFGAILFGWILNWCYKNKEKPIGRVTTKEWSWFFFWCFITHTLLDCCTMYGTQVFAPFSDYRLAFSIVAVADFFYTIPFIICLIIASRFRKDDKRRSRWNWMGIAWSCFYLLLTFFNKQHVTSVYKSELVKQGIEYERLLVGPTILSNFLWSGAVETRDQDQSIEYYLSQYSVFDSSPIKFSPVRQNLELLENQVAKDNTLSTLSWFANGYFNVQERKDGNLQLNDLRFGTFGGQLNDEDDFIFRFPIQLNENGNYELLKVGKGPADGKRQDMMGKIWERIKGQ